MLKYMFLNYEFVLIEVNKLLVFEKKKFNNKVYNNLEII